MTEPTNLFSRVARDLGLPISGLLALARSSPYRYKVYSIPKRSGEGRRLIAQPARELKVVQRWLVTQELQSLPVHSASTAYGKGCSIQKNAMRHSHGRYLLKADFSNFFPSIKERDLRAHLTKYSKSKYSEIEVDFLCRILLWREFSTRGLSLCIGAPSSPFIANSITYDFDDAVHRLCVEQEIEYTRYADDLAFSTNRPDCLRTMLPFVRDLARRLEYPRLMLNEDKVVFTSKKYRRTITGLVISSENKVSLGRDRKRLIRAMVHRFVQDSLEEAEKLRLRGLVAFAQDAEPEFVERLGRRYSTETIDKIKRYVSSRDRERD